MARLQRLADVGEMETTLLVLPEASRVSPLNAWTSSPSGASRRRQIAEEVMITAAEESDDGEAGTSSAGSPVFSAVSDKDIPSCFSTKDKCESATGNCSGHGTCREKYSGSTNCFTCHCESTVSGSNSTTHWAGATCSKVDVSVPFWLFAGFTIFMLGIVSLAIATLFNLGEERLPGVIGAGVSKSK